MKVNYFYCSACDFEYCGLFTVAYSRQTASSEWCYCPDCGEESSNFEIVEGY